MKGLATLLASLLLCGGLTSFAGAETTPSPGGMPNQAGAIAEESATASVPVRANLAQLEDEVMCPICGTLLGMSRAPAAERQRVFMRKLIAEGKTNEEIKDALVVELGPQVLGLPDDDRINFFVYLVPLIGLILATLVVFWAAVRWRRGRGPDGPDTPGGGSRTPGKDGGESERLDRDLAEYDL
ncbi:MAG: cytochrome c-type biogenesis protein CcmH [Solirubrobacterales bacterium]